MHSRGIVCMYAVLDLFILGINHAFAITCIVGYNPYEKECLQCASPCTSCRSYSDCSNCESGDNGTICQYDCKSCKKQACSHDGCIKGCKYGYFKDNGMCSACRSTCLSCFDLNTCDRCVPGKYGQDCQNSCLNCKGSFCNKDTGECLYNNTCPQLCTSCTSSTQCGSCEVGRWGHICRHKCDEKCKDAVCDQYTGACLKGCVDGNYLYGIRCDSCPENCETCISNAVCLSCKAGAMSGYCERACPHNCTNKCHQFTGLCAHGCKDGYYKSSDSHCSVCPTECLTCSSDSMCLSCKTGKWGVTCTSSCTNCKDDTCHISNGACISGCVSGYYMTQGVCEPCRDGSFGVECQGECDSNCKACYDSRRNCTKCHLGFYISRNTCNPCSRQCKGKEICLQSDGTCEKGCKAGWHNLRCDTQCFVQCNICEQTNGKCVQCVDDHYGEKCEHNCSRHCVKQENGLICDIHNGKCMDGCEGGYTGKTCSEGPVEVASTKLPSPQDDQHVKNDIYTKIPTSKSSQHVEDDTNNAMIGGAAGGAVVLLIIVGGIVVFAVMRKRKNRTPDAEIPTSSTVTTSRPAYQDNTDAENLHATPNTVKPNKDPPLITLANKSSRQDSPLLAPYPILDIDVDVEDVELDYGSDVYTPTTGTINPVDDSIYYTNVAGLKRSRIQVDTLQDYVAKKTKDGIRDEFQKLPQGLTRPCNEACKPENRVKNRYRDIYPYDVSRVKLTGGATDFINANYIDGYNQLKTYIASLGPTSKTMDDFVDFWRMVWQENVEKIVMLTNLIEDMKMKCEQYWPEVGASHSYGDVTVICHSEEAYAEYVVKRLTVNKGNEKRSLNHLHFTGWQDKGVPDDVTSLIEFRQKVESTRAELGGPTIVHCSAGVGRTGTYIALDILTKEGHAEKSVDIFGCVIGMRSQRVYMVQTQEQYEYLHNSVVHALTFDCQAIQSYKFQHYTADSTEELYTQFAKITSTGEKKSMEESDAVKWNTNLHDKNRKGADVPGNQHRPRLYLRRTEEESDYINATFVNILGVTDTRAICDQYALPVTFCDIYLRRTEEESDYINATFVNSYKSKKRYIVAQTPLPGTVVDFLTLVFQENCSCIVSMDDEQSKDKMVGVYFLPENQILKQETFRISCSSVESTPHYKHRKLTIQHQGVNWYEEKTVNHFQLTCWEKTSLVPNDSSTFLKFIQAVEKTSLDFTEMGPILIHCLNGAERSGLFCAVSVLIQKMKIEHEVSVVNTIRQIKSRRGAAIPNKEQYIFCHQCIVAFLQTFDS